MLSFVRSARAQPRSIQSRGFSAAAAAAAAKHNPTPHSAVRNHVPQFTNLPPIPKDFYIVDTTLREGEQFATCEFTSRDRVYIAKTLDSVGVDYIELVNPLASKQAARDCEEIAKLNLKSKIVAHTRCHMDDVRVACQSGINGVNLYMATSPILSKHSHGKGIDEVIDIASEVIKYVKQHKMEVRFSCEDAFRSNKDDILRIYAAVDKLGVNRVGVADTVGVATPFEVYETLKAVRGVLKPTTDIEFHTHNDTGCCIANAFTALQGGATHIDTCVLGIGERNGITPLGGFLARMYTLDKETVMKKYDLKLLHHLERYVAQRAYVTIPFNNYITGMSAFTHKAGVHSKAVMQAPSAYEVIDPKDWGVERRIQFAHRLTGWNAMKQRAKDLGLEVSDEQIKAATVSIKNLAEDRPISMEELDTILLKLAKISAPQAQFIVWDEDVAEKSKGKKSESVQKQVDDVIRSLEPAKVDMRPTRKLQVKGHLFDKAVLNRLLDIIVDSPCEFTVLHLDVPANNASHSHAILQLWADSDDDISRTKSQLHAVVQALQPVAECELTDYTGPNHQHHAPPRRKN